MLQHRPLNSETDMVIVDSDEGGVDVAGTTGGVSGVIRGAEDVASGMGTVEGVVRAGDMISVGISACCVYSFCGISRCTGLVGALEVQHKQSYDSICRE